MIKLIFSINKMVSFQQNREGFFLGMSLSKIVIVINYHDKNHDLGNKICQKKNKRGKKAGEVKCFVKLLTISHDKAFFLLLRISENTKRNELDLIAFLSSFGWFTTFFFVLTWLGLSTLEHLLGRAPWVY